MKKKRKNITFNDKTPYEVPDAIGEKVTIKKNEKIHMNKKICISVSMIVLSLVTMIIFSLLGCTAMDPIADKNVEYVFENVSYESPNSSPHDNIGEAEGKFNFGKKLPI